MKFPVFPKMAVIFPNLNYTLALVPNYIKSVLFALFNNNILIHCHTYLALNVGFIKLSWDFDMVGL